LGDCYEQLCCIRELKRANPSQQWIGFFAVPNRLAAMQHFQLDMFEEVHSATNISRVPVDGFFQFQIRDAELRRDVIDRLPPEVRARFDFRHNWKPWGFIRRHDFNRCGMALPLSQQGRNYLPLCMKYNEISTDLFRRHFTVGYLWRYRAPGGFIATHGQRSADWILRTKSELFRQLIESCNAHILVAGMGKNSETSILPPQIRERGAFVEGEYRAKFTEAVLDVPRERVTYLKGLGFAAEMEIMAQCDLLLMMPSGFSEALWMRRTVPVVLVDPPPAYVARLWLYRMPLFNHRSLAYAIHNTFVPHTANHLLRFLRKHGLLQKRSRPNSLPPLS